jgi:coatomer protein complex subunit gamma
MIPILTKQQEEAERIRMYLLMISCSHFNVLKGQKASKLDNTADAALPTKATSEPLDGAQMASGQDIQIAYGEQMAKHADLVKLGYPFKSSVKPLELTESETEYVVKCIKHVFAEHVVFQVSLISQWIC